MRLLARSQKLIAGAGDGDARVCTVTSRVRSRFDLVLVDAVFELCLLCVSPWLLGLECISSVWAVSEDNRGLERGKYLK